MKIIHAVISTYPRKGTETSAISLDGEWMPISTYPRKGTETSIHNDAYELDAKISIYPRKGTETVRIYPNLSTVSYFNLSPQGDGNGIAA